MYDYNAAEKLKQRAGRRYRELLHSILCKKIVHHTLGEKLALKTNINYLLYEVETWHSYALGF